MSYTYLITGATSDVGRALIERLLQTRPPIRLCWPRAAAIWKSWLASAARFPVRCARSTWTCRTAPRSIPSCRCWRPSAPRADAFHPPARAAVVNAKFKAFDQTRFDRDLEIQVHSAVRLCRAVLARHGQGQVWPCAVHPDELHHRLPAQEYHRLRHGQERHRRAGQEPGRRVCPLRRHGQLRPPPA